MPLQHNPTADLEFSDSVDSKESLDDHHTSLAELVFAAEQRPSGGRHRHACD